MSGDTNSVVGSVDWKLERLSQKSNRLFWAKLCPVCECEEWKDLELKPADDRFSRAYTELGIEVDTISFVQCANCECIWRRPWIESNAQLPVYNDLTPHHKGGESCFFQGSVTRQGPAKLNNFFIKYLTKFDRYGELGCPIWGLMPYYGRNRYQAGAGLANVGPEATLLFATASEIFNSPSWKMRLLRSVLMLSLSYRPSELYFIEPPNSIFPNQSCQIGGAYCRDIAKSLSGFQTISNVSDLSEPLDLLSVILYLDHVPDPVSELGRLTKIAKHIFIWTHGLNVDSNVPQHFVNFCPKGLLIAAKSAGLSHMANYLVRGPNDNFGMLFRTEK